MSKIRKLLILPMVALSLAIVACSSTPPVSSIADMASFSDVKAEKKALVLMANSGQPCEESAFEFQNTSTQEIVEMEIIQRGRARGFSVGQPAMVTMEPGEYKIISGNCASHPYQTIFYSDIEKWFKPFQVQGGDVKFLGNLQVSAAKGEGRQGIVNAVTGRLLNLGLSTNKPTDYIVLKTLDAPSSAKLALRTNYPDLLEDFVSAPLEARIDAAKFREIVAAAYSLDETGKAPLKSDAHKNVRKYIDSFN